MTQPYFTPDACAFLAELAENNDRDWFAANKLRYEAHIKAPAQTFVDALSAEFTECYQVAARPKIFRLHRDLRFSKDKRPYNTHLHMAVMDGDTGPGWMVGLEPREGRVQLDLGYGCLGFDKAHLQRWRTAVDGPEGAGLSEALGAMRFRLPQAELKRVPAPFAADHPRAEHLRRKSFSVWLPSPDPDEILGPRAVDRIAQLLTGLAPVRGWLQDQVYDGAD